MTNVGVHTDEGPDVVRISLRGELDLSNVLSVEEELRRVEGRRDSLVLDLSGLRFIDSTGLRLLLSAHQRARKHGRRLRIVPGSAAVKRLFRLSGLEHRFEFVERA